MQNTTTSVVDRRQILARTSGVKVLVSGVFATGKTTLCNRVIHRLITQGVLAELVPEVSRECPFVLHREQTPLASIWLAAEQIRAEVVALAKPRCQVVVCDRSVPDFLLHTSVLDLTSAHDQRMSRVFLRLISPWARTYDLVYWAKIDRSREIENDGVRVADREYQLLLEKSISMAFRKLRLTPIVLPRSTLSRERIVLQQIKKLLQTSTE